jgi:hypothetical protein
MSPGQTGDTDRCRNGDPAVRGTPQTTLRVTLPALPVSDSLVRDRVRRWLRALLWPQGLMRACMEDVRIEGTDHGTEIRLRSRTVPPPITDER